MSFESIATSLNPDSLRCGSSQGQAASLARRLLASLATLDCFPRFGWMASNGACAPVFPSGNRESAATEIGAGCQEVSSPSQVGYGLLLTAPFIEQDKT